MGAIALSILAFVGSWTQRQVLAQSIPTTGDYAQGLTPTHSFSGSDIDHVSLNNHNINLTIPLFSYPQVGDKLKFGFHVSFNNKGWVQLGVPNTNPALPPTTFYWFQRNYGPVVVLDESYQASRDSMYLRDPSYIPPLPPGGGGGGGEGGGGCTDIFCWCIIDGDCEEPPDPNSLTVTPQAAPGPGYLPPIYLYSALDSDGSSHAFGVDESQINSGAGLFYAMDGSGLRIANEGTGAYKVVDQKGTTYTNGLWLPPGVTTNNVAPYVYNPAAYEGTIQDVDGNEIVWTGSGWKDSTGRRIPMSAISSDVTVAGGGNVPGILTTNLSRCPTGTTQAFEADIPGRGAGGLDDFTFCYTDFKINPNLQRTGIQDRTYTVHWLIAVVLPNGKSWQFHFDQLSASGISDGMLTRVDMPTGGWITYTYGNGLANGNSGLSEKTLIARTVSDGNGHSSIWTYVDPNHPKASVTNPDGSFEVHNFDDQENEIEADYYDAHGNELKSVTITRPYAAESPYDNDGYTVPMNPEPTMITTGIASAGSATPNLFSSVSIDYDNLISPQLTYYDPYQDASGNNPYTPYNLFYGEHRTQTSYDFSTTTSPGVPLNATRTTYQWENSATGQSYVANNLMGLPSTVTVQDGSGSTAASTSYFYDENNGSPQGAFGNLTSIIHNGNAGISPASHGIYNANGTIRQSIDPDGNSTFTSYGCSGELPSSVTKAYRSTTTQPETTIYTFDCPSGTLMSIQDPNDLANGRTGTTYSLDMMNNLTAISYPDGGGVSYDHHSYANPPSVTATRHSSPNPDVVTTTNYDGIGREVSSSVDSATQPIHTYTNYDLMSRVQSVSNPYYTMSDPTFDLTLFQYDGLGRKILAQHQADQSVQTWVYSANATTFTDENGSSWTQTSDALGRLTHLLEPGNLLTDYTYDVLGNLKVVFQHGLSTEAPRSRNFAYDSLSRLITSSNPETGKICYGLWSGGAVGAGQCQNGYDANGNLLAKTDANGVTMSYNYDALNRLLSKTASDGSVADTYTYDQSSAGTNEIGRLSMADHSGAAGNTFSYDPMGRVSSGTYYTPKSNGWQPSVGVGYDLAGNPTTITYPDGNQITQVFDTAGRLASVINNGSGVSYISGITYTPAGAESTFTLGNGVSQTDVYNSRLQPCRTTVKNPLLASRPGSGTGGPVGGPVSVNAGDILDRESFYNPSASTNCGSEANNNGNIWSIVDNLNTGWTQSFGYDGLNRLTSAFRSDGGYNHTYHYDSFGNMAVTDNLHSNPVWGVDPATNQLLQNPVAGVTDGYGHPLNNYTYDNAGNMVSSGSFPVGHAYQYNALNQINCVDCGNGGSNPTAVYTYNGDDERVYKQTATDWSQYVYFNGQVMAEQASPGTWSDYIYANGQKIAKVDSQRAVFQLTGYRDLSNAGCGLEGPLNGASPGIVGLVIATGDQLVFDFQQSVPSYGGLGLIFTNGDGSGDAVDTNGTGQLLYFDGEADGQWHHMVGSLAKHVGETVAYPLIGLHYAIPYGNFVMSYANAAVVHSNGSVTPIYTGQPGVSVSSFTGSNGGGQNLTNGTVLTPLTDPTMNVSYFVDDHLGTAQMELSGGGWPMWQGQFTPFGLELPDGSIDMEFKFTGKERDAESGLDYFGARYYASSMGRWMSPDWSAKEEPVPYAKLDNPQTLNLYGYVGNNPLSRVDADGHQQEEDAESEAELAMARNARNALRPVQISPREAEQLGWPTSQLNPVAEAFRERYTSGTGGRWGSNLTRNQNATIADLFTGAGYKIVGGVEGKEEWLPGPGGGSKGATYVDLTVRKGDETIRVQTVTMGADGKLDPKEAAAAARIRSQFPHDKLILVPKTAPRRPASSDPVIHPKVK